MRPLSIRWEHLLIRINWRSMGLKASWMNQTCLNELSVWKHGHFEMSIRVRWAWLYQFFRVSIGAVLRGWYDPRLRFQCPMEDNEQVFFPPFFTGKRSLNMRLLQCFPNRRAGAEHMYPAGWFFSATRSKPDIILERSYLKSAPKRSHSTIPIPVVLCLPESFMNWMCQEYHTLKPRAKFLMAAKNIDGLQIGSSFFKVHVELERCVSHA